MKFARHRLVPTFLALAAVACGQSSTPGGTSPTPAGGSSGSLGGAGTSALGGGGSSASAGAGAANAGSAGLAAAGAGGSSASGGAGSGGASGAAGGVAGAGGAVAAGSGCTAPGTICWDFEEGTLPTGWTPYRNEFDGTLLVDNTKSHQGTYSLHAKGLKGGQLTVQGGPKKTMLYNLPANFGPVLWGRMWVFTTTVPQSHSGLFNARYTRPNATDNTIANLDWYEVATYTGDYMSIWHPPEPPGYPEWVKVSGTAGVANAWACLEWEFDGSNGTQPEAADPRMWLNGTELTWPMQFVFSDPATTVRLPQEKATNFTILETGVYLYQGLPDGSDTWIDQLAVGKERIGCQ